MGIYDRDYYRREGGGAMGSFAAPGKVCRLLILINIVAFVIQLATRDNPNGMGGRFTDLFDLNVDAVLSGQVWRLITHAFLHDLDWMHIVFNMLALWWFGRAMEDIYGPKEFLGFYLFAALAGGLAYCGFNLVMHRANPALGASGAVIAVMVLFAMHYPKATVLLFFFIPMPVIVLVVLFVAFDTLGLMGARQGANVAFAAHLGGALFGFLYYKFNWRVLRWWPTRMSMRPRRQVRPRLRVFRAPPEEDAVSSDTPNREEMLEAQVDAVLEKVARYGKASLTEHENQLLLKASEVYKQRRK